MASPFPLLDALRDRIVERIPEAWRERVRDLEMVVEIFVIFNLACLALDIYLAHSTNGFRRRSELIPLYFSIVAPFGLVAGLLARARWQAVSVWRDVGYLVGWLALLVGFTGVILHLDSRFFYERTIESLTYAAPFAAPLAYCGLGLLLVLNRMLRADSEEWARWTLLLAAGGFAGNFVFSLTDHAVNGFFRSRGMDPRRRKRVRREFPGRPVPRRRREGVPQAVRGRSRSRGADRRRRIRPARVCRPAGSVVAVPKCFERRATARADAVPEPRHSWMDCALRAVSACSRERRRSRRHRARDRSDECLRPPYQRPCIRAPSKNDARLATTIAVMSRRRDSRSRKASQKSVHSAAGANVSATRR